VNVSDVKLQVVDRLLCRVCWSSTDKMKPSMVAKLAIQCSDLYADAVKLLQLESIKSLWPKVSDAVQNHIRIS